MALQKITAGMEKGPEAIEANFEAHDASITALTNKVAAPDAGWTNTGVTTMNGFTADDTHIQYHVVKKPVENITYVYITGYLSLEHSGAQDSGTGKACAALPTAVMQLPDGTVGHTKSIIGRSFVTNGGLPVAVGFSATAQLSIIPKVRFENYESMFIDIVAIVTA